MAARAVAAIRAEWKTTPQPSATRPFRLFEKESGRGQGSEGRSNYTRGSIAEGLAAAHQKLERTYTVAYIAHAPLEPRAAVAEWNDGKLTVWTGTQRPFGVRGELAAAFRIPEDRVRVIVPDTGSGYGGKQPARPRSRRRAWPRRAGKPVKLVWTREEEFTWAYFRPAGVIEIASARQQGRHDHGLGVSQLQLRLVGAFARSTRFRTSGSSFTASTRPCVRVRIARWLPPPITSRAKSTSTSWRKA